MVVADVRVPVPADLVAKLVAVEVDAPLLRAAGDEVAPEVVVRGPLAPRVLARELRRLLRLLLRRGDVERHAVVAVHRARVRVCCGGGRRRERNEGEAVGRRRGFNETASRSVLGFELAGRGGAGRCGGVSLRRCPVFVGVNTFWCSDSLGHKRGQGTAGEQGSQ